MFVLIPAYKPDERMLTLIDELHGRTDYRILVVNDGSGSDFDHVFAAVPDYCTVLTHEVNMGKGRAMKTGFAYILENFPGEGAVIADCDGQHTCDDILKTGHMLEENPHSLVIGCREFKNDIPFRSRFGNKMTIFMFRLVSGKKVSDTQTGLRGIPSDSLSFMTEIPGDRYEYEMNMLLYAVKQKIDIKEIGIETVYIDNNASSHFNVLRDSFRIYKVLLKFAFVRILSFLKFAGSSFISYAVDYIMAILLDTILSKSISKSASLFISTYSARAVSSVLNYILNKKLVFRNEDSVTTTAFRYFMLAVAVILVGSGILYVLDIELGMNLAVAKPIVDTALYFVNYFIQKKFIFKNNKE